MNRLPVKIQNFVDRQQTILGIDVKKTFFVWLSTVNAVGDFGIFANVCIVGIDFENTGAYW